MIRLMKLILLTLVCLGATSCIEDSNSSQAIPEFRILCESEKCRSRESNGIHRAYGFLTTSNCSNPISGLILESETEVFCNGRGCTGVFDDWYDGEVIKTDTKVSSLQACFSIDFKGKNKALRSYSTDGNLRSRFINFKVKESSEVVYIYEWTEV